ncbi:hypothetical protein ACFQU1_23870 [Chelatococcus sp. GCM10030263]|uniref:hypothetical protein n=1 Tax=Chelatococcus sp. GCM10030263 TaxID=3273387 RepID=UPI00361A80C0
MADLRVPSVQHLARNWNQQPTAIARALVQLARNPPHFNYNPLYAAVQDMLVLGVPYDEVEKGIRRIKRENVRQNLLSVLPLIRNHFSDVSPDFYQTVGKRYYPVGRGLMVPFEPPLIYGVGGQLYFPWFSFWRTNPLAKERLALFVTLVDEILMQDPDLETARFEILDFSCPGPKQERTLRVVDARDIIRLDDRRKVEMLECFAEGYFQAVAELRGAPASPRPEERPDSRSPDPDQPGLFD